MGVAELPVDILWAENRFRCVSGPVAAPADFSTMEAQHLPLHSMPLGAAGHDMGLSWRVKNPSAEMG